MAVKIASEMTYTVSGGALNSAQSNPFGKCRFFAVEGTVGRLCFRHDDDDDDDDDDDVHVACALLLLARYVVCMLLFLLTVIQVQ